MRYITNIDNIEFNRPQAVTIGKFDGIHLGHNYLIKDILNKKYDGFEACVITFSVSPTKVLSDNSLKNLISKEERNRILSDAGVDNVIEFSFDDKFIKTSATDFIKMLTEQLNMKYLAVGENFHFGYKNQGDVRLLSELSHEYDFELNAVKLLRAYDDAVSSTRIREEIKFGHVSLVKELLGYNYFICGKIVHGNHIGRTINFPTVNIIPEPDKCLPKFGVYFTNVFYNNKTKFGITNVGVKPTVSDDGVVCVETFILDEDTDLYDCDVRVEFIERMRDEIKFDSVDALKEQLRKDVEYAYSLIDRLL